MDVFQDGIITLLVCPPKSVFWNMPIDEVSEEKDLLFARNAAFMTNSLNKNIKKTEEPVKFLIVFILPLTPVA